jgi:hypothetical protein
MSARNRRPPRAPRNRRQQPRNVPVEPQPELAADRLHISRMYARFADMQSIDSFRQHAAKSRKAKTRTLFAEFEALHKVFVSSAIRAFTKLVFDLRCGQTAMNLDTRTVTMTEAFRFYVGDLSKPAGRERLNVFFRHCNKMCEAQTALQEKFDELHKALKLPNGSVIAGMVVPSAVGIAGIATIIGLVVAAIFVPPLAFVAIGVGVGLAVGAAGGVAGVEIIRNCRLNDSARNYKQIADRTKRSVELVTSTVAMEMAPAVPDTNAGANANAADAEPVGKDGAVAPDTSLLQIMFQSLTGVKFKVQLAKTTTFKEIKEVHLVKAFGIAAVDMRVIFCGAIMRDEATLEGMGCGADTCLHVVETSACVAARDATRLQTKKELQLIIANTDTLLALLANMLIE